MSDTEKPSRVEALLKEVNVALDAQGRGSRTRLAEEMGVVRQVVNDWLSGRRKPDGEHTLALMKWLKRVKSMS